MTAYIDCWVKVATDLFQQALAGEPELVDSLPRPFPAGSFGYTAVLTGEEEGRFSIVCDASILEAPLLGEGADQKSGWGELLQETINAAVGELLASTGKKCRVEKFEEIVAESKVSRAFQLKSAEHSWTILVRDEVRPPKAVAASEVPKRVAPGPAVPSAGVLAATGTPPGLSPGLELLLDVELEASLRFGCREMPLGEILDLGPGDVVQLDRHVADPVDLVVGDKIVARGEVVLVNGNFGLKVMEVAAPRKRLESIRCLF